MSKGKKNGYTCDTCQGHIVTVDVDEGVTPFMIACRATEGCDGMMKSHFYSIDQRFIATHEWYKPELESCPEGWEEHVKRGGLALRKIGTNEP